MDNQRPLIFDIKRHSLLDGPGIRTTIFFKGCPLRCEWCHNPESIEPGLEIAFYPSRCIQCGNCARACPHLAARMDLAGRIDRGVCRRCGTCAAACPARALRQVGRFHDVDELVEITLRDRVYYQTSNGGVTLSGGEPALWPHFASRLLRQLKSQAIHTAIETCGQFEWQQFRKHMLDWLDLILFDVKLADPELHLKYTGVRNQVIMANLARLIRERPGDVIARVPLIPGTNTDAESLERIIATLEGTGVARCWLLPYNPLGTSKREAIGLPAIDVPRLTLSPEEMARIRGLFHGMELVEM